VAGCAGELRKRHDDEDNVPESSSDDSASGDLPLNPGIFEKWVNYELSRQRRSAEDGAQAASDSLMETAPGNVERWQTRGV
jgi:hypothetical protein